MLKKKKGFGSLAKLYKTHSFNLILLFANSHKLPKHFINFIWWKTFLVLVQWYNGTQNKALLNSSIYYEIKALRQPSGELYWIFQTALSPDCHAHPIQGAGTWTHVHTYKQKHVEQSRGKDTSIVIAHSLKASRWQLYLWVGEKVSEIEMMGKGLNLQAKSTIIVNDFKNLTSRLDKQICLHILKVKLITNPCFLFKRAPFCNHSGSIWSYSLAVGLV